ncbi:hypothetical protein ACVPOH_003666, partial [Pseudomonas aeruginosa]
SAVVSKKVEKKSKKMPTLLITIQFYLGKSPEITGIAQGSPTITRGENGFKSPRLHQTQTISH